MDAHLAQINIGTMVAPTDDPAVAEFMNALDHINALADDAPGFVWRLQTDEGNATSIQIFPDPLQLVNLSVWESIDSLKAYVYRSGHVDFFRRRAEWFEADAKRVALWWIPAGTQPGLDDAVRRVEFLERHGPSPYAFGFAHAPEPFLIEPTELHDPTARSLIERLDGELRSQYEADDTHFELETESVADDRGEFVLATLAGEAVACGAIRRLDDHVAEVKRMYVAPEARGRKIGAAMLDRLESVAGRLGVSEIVLETGIHQHAAIGLYHAAGYTRTELWGEYLRSPDTSLAYRKELNR